MFKLLLGEVLHHPVRSLLCTVMIAVALLLGLVMKGLATGVLTEKIARTQGIGADLMLQPPRSSYLLGLGENVMPASIADKLLEVGGVEATTPVATNVSFTNRLEAVFGIDIPSFDRLSGGFYYIQGGPFTAPFTALVDDVYVRTHRVELGSTLDILNHQFRVCGIVEHGRGARVFVPLATLQELIAPGKCSIIFIKCKSPSLADTVKGRLLNFQGGALRDYQLTALSELTSLITPSSLVGLRQFMIVVVVFAAVINFLVIFLALYVQVLGQTREIGILRALGATRAYLVNLFLGEACLLCLAGVLLSLLFYELTKMIVVTIYPGLSFLLPLSSLLRTVAIAVVSAILGAGYPAYRAAQREPVTALAYE